MSGIKDLHGLLFWLDNTKRSSLEQVLANSRMLPKEKASIMRDLEEEKRLQEHPVPPPFDKKPPGGITW